MYCVIYVSSIPFLYHFCRVGGAYDERRFLDERYTRDNSYPRDAFHPDNREDYPPPAPSASGIWSQSRRRSYEDEYPIDRGSRRYEKPYNESYQDLDAFNEHEFDTYQDFDRFRDDYRSLSNVRDHGIDRLDRFGSRERDDYAYDDYDYKSNVAHQKRDDSYERDYDYGRYRYDSDYDRGSRREGTWRRRESRDRERDKRGSSWDRDPSPHRRHDRSKSRGRDDRSRSRSPRGRSHGRNYREDSYEENRHERSERRRDREEKRDREHYSVVCFLGHSLLFYPLFMTE